MALERVSEMLQRAAQSARIETVYGEGRQLNGKTVIPVARVMYGGGGGEGSGKRGESGEGEGGGGGLGVHVQPLGVFVVTEHQERWVPVIDTTRVILAGCAVATLALLTVGRILGRRR